MQNKTVIPPSPAEQSDVSPGSASSGIAGQRVQWTWANVC